MLIIGTEGEIMGKWIEAAWALLRGAAWGITVGCLAWILILAGTSRPAP
jgi:hypothetical protein